MDGLEGGWIGGEDEGSRAIKYVIEISEKRASESESRPPESPFESTEPRTCSLTATVHFPHSFDITGIIASLFYLDIMSDHISDQHRLLP